MKGIITMEEIRARVGIICSSGLICFLKRSIDQLWRIAHVWDMYTCSNLYNPLQPEKILICEELWVKLFADLMVNEKFNKMTREPKSFWAWLGRKRWKCAIIEKLETQIQWTFENFEIIWNRGDLSRAVHSEVVGNLSKLSLSLTPNKALYGWK